VSAEPSGAGVTLGELWRQGDRIETAVQNLDTKLDTTNDTVIRHDGMIIGHSAAIAEIRAELKSKRVSTATLAGVVATVITVVGQVVDHIH
jgi:hypothetical protein